MRAKRFRCCLVTRLPRRSPAKAGHLSLVTVCALLVSAANLFPQGSLTPPAAPTPTMKSLDQIEARTPISSAPYTISQPGSYYLTNNLTVSGGDAIYITCDNVTLDLNGFTIFSTAETISGAAISLTSSIPRDNIRILNGHIVGNVTYQGGGTYSGGGFQAGILHDYYGLAGARIERVSIRGCYLGIFLGVDSGGSYQPDVIDSCTVYSASYAGIIAAKAIVTRCSATYIGGNAISAYVVADSYGFSSVNNTTAIRGVTAINSMGQVNGNGTGLFAWSAQNCYGSGGGVGLYAYTAENCFGGGGSGGTGLRATLATGCYGGNSYNGIGIQADVLVNCWGQSEGPSYGIIADRLAKGCFGWSGANYSNSGGGVGISASPGANVSDCTAVAGSYGGNTGRGIWVFDGATVRNCSVFNSTIGILVAGSKCLIEGNSLDNNSAGIRVDGTGNRIDGNRTSVPDGGQGFQFNGTNNLIIRNTARINGTNTNQYSLNVAGNTYGPIVNVIGAGQIATEHPWANFIY